MLPCGEDFDDYFRGKEHLDNLVYPEPEKKHLNDMSSQNQEACFITKAG